MLQKGVIRIYLKMILVRYILAICIAAVAVTLIIVVYMKKRKTESKVYRAVRSFEFVVLAVIVFCFSTFCREMIFAEYHYGIIWRVTDCALYEFIVYSWICVLAAMNGKKFFRSLGLAVVMCEVVPGSVIAAFFTDGGFIIINRTANLIAKILTLATGAAEAVIILILLADIFKSEIDITRRVFAVMNSLLMIAWRIFCVYIDAGISDGAFGKSAWDIQTVDFTSIAMLIIAAITLVYVYKEDFSPLFIAYESYPRSKDPVLDGQQMENSPEPAAEVQPGSVSETGREYMADHDKTSAYASESNRTDYGYTQREEKKNNYIDSGLIALVAQNSKLTVREYETCCLLVDGMSNQEIADELCITVNTVKKHTKNIYAKIGVSGRMDLILFMNNRRNEL